MPRTREGADAINPFLQDRRFVYKVNTERTDDTPSIFPSVQDSMFGGCLEDAVDKETGVSQFVVWCVRAIETTGDNLKTDELYKKFGEDDKVKEIMNTVEKDMQEKLEKEENVHVLTGALKLFLKQLKEPLLDPNKLQYISLQSMDGFCRETKKVIASFGVVHQETLKYIMKHLKEVLKHSASNHMSAESLGLAFGPVFMSLDFVETRKLGREVTNQITIVEHFLNNYQILTNHNFRPPFYR